MRRHAFDPLSFTFGLLFAGIGILSLAGAVDIALLDRDLLWPSILIIVGVALLLSLTGSRDAAADAPPSAEAATTTDAPTTTEGPTSAGEHAARPTGQRLDKPTEDGP